MASSASSTFSSAGAATLAETMVDLDRTAHDVLATRDGRCQCPADPPAQHMGNLRPEISAGSVARERHQQMLSAALRC